MIKVVVFTDSSHCVNKKIYLNYKMAESEKPLLAFTVSLYILVFTTAHQASFQINTGAKQKFIVLLIDDTIVYKYSFSNEKHVSTNICIQC